MPAGRMAKAFGAWKKNIQDQLCITLLKAVAALSNNAVAADLPQVKDLGRTVHDIHTRFARVASEIQSLDALVTDGDHGEGDTQNLGPRWEQLRVVGQPGMVPARSEIF